MVMLPGYGSVAFYQNFLLVDLFYCCIFTAAKYECPPPFIFCLWFKKPKWSIAWWLSAFLFFMQYPINQSQWRRVLYYLDWLRGRGFSKSAELRLPENLNLDTVTTQRYFDYLKAERDAEH
jgi:hypothetical protein